MSDADQLLGGKITMTQRVRSQKRTYKKMRYTLRWSAALDSAPVTLGQASLSRSTHTKDGELCLSKVKPLEMVDHITTWKCAPSNWIADSNLLHWNSWLRLFLLINVSASSAGLYGRWTWNQPDGIRIPDPPLLLGVAVCHTYLPVTYVSVSEVQ